MLKLTLLLHLEELLEAHYYKSMFRWVYQLDCLSVFFYSGGYT